MGTVLYVTAEVLRAVAVATLPFIPGAAAKLLDLLAVEPGERIFARVGPAGRLAPGTKLPAPAAIFPRYVEPEA